jgi:hypothetical protein
MSYEIISHVESLFSDKEQWDSFLDIANARNFIRDTWWKKFLSEMNKSVKFIQNWGYATNNHFDYHWYINEFGMNSFCLIAANLGNRFSLGLWAPQNKYNIKKLSELLKQEKYGEPIKAKFDRLDYIGDETAEWKYAEYFAFDGLKGSEPDIYDRLAWYANYKTTELVSELISKINKFREDEEITKILSELNNETMLK